MVAIICEPRAFIAVLPNADHHPSDGSLAGAFLVLILVTPYVSPARQRV